MTGRFKVAATRAAVIALVMFFLLVWKRQISLALPLSRRTIIGIGVLLGAWIMLTTWQMRSRVERWPWISVLIGYVICLFAFFVVSYAVVRVGFRL